MSTENGAEKDLYPLALLMDDLKHDDINNRVEAMKKLNIIAAALGPERTRNELVPFLTEVAQDDEDEVFTVLAEEVGTLVPLVGGPEYAALLLAPLEILASTEETLVRDKAVESLNAIAQALSQEQLLQDFIPLLERLATATWFSAKVSSCGLFRSVIVRVKDDVLRHNLLLLYLQLVQDETPMVRRAAAKNLPTVIDLLTQNPELPTADNWDTISTMFQKIMQDSQDSVRFLAVESLISILNFFNHKGDISSFPNLLESARALIGDGSWRVRYMVADKFPELTQQLATQPELLTQLLEPFLSLCEDNEADVRKAIAKQISDFSALLNKPKILLERVLPAVRGLSMDENEAVRASLALKLNSLVLLLPKDDTIEFLLPLLLNMLKDEFPDVRLNIIGNLKVVNDAIGIDMLSESLLPAITELAKDVNWRVRLAIIQYIPILAEQLGMQFFDQQLSDLCLSWLWDTVYSIREAAVQNLQKLAEIFGSDWTRDEVIAKLLKFDSQLLENFVYRFTLLSVLVALVPVISPDVVINQILAFVVHLSNDMVPNIRFNVAKAYPIIAQRLKSDPQQYNEIMSTTIRPSLEKLITDPDVDVKYFSEQSMQECNKISA